MDRKRRDEWLQLPLSEVFGRAKDFGPGEMPELHQNVLRAFYATYPLLPIEFLKEDPSTIEKSFPAPPVHSFLSSGTTARDRSRSAFSGPGLQDYRDFSLLSFRAMLHTFFGERRVPGISMIPPVSVWPQSSLAQMVAWIGEDFPLDYWREDLPSPKEPVWLFATGFHIVAFADEGGCFPLPPGSIVIETGGTKGKTRSVTRDETYALIEKCFRVDRNHIVSEYGMCELASQAYDFVKKPNGPIRSLHERSFRFPSWVQTKILNASQEVRDEGNGSLIVNDQARSDIKTPFRTEDRVELRADGSFQLEGRVAFSPLKGCSLLAEDILAPAPAVEPIREAEVKKMSHTHSPEDLKERATRIHSLTQSMLKDEKFAALVRRNLVLEQPTQWWLKDLEASVPQSVDAWIQAAQETGNQSSSWLMIPPRTHDFALMHPLFMAALLNIKVVVRETKDTEIFRYWQDLFKGFWSFSILNSDWRLEEGTALPAQSLLVFGSDETIEDLRSKTSHSVHGFGSWVTITIIHKDSWASDAWVKDAFSLKQEGCMSSRLLVVWDAKVPEALPEKSVVIGQLSPSEQLHLAHSELDLALKGFHILPRPDRQQLVLGHRPFGKRDRIHDLLSTRPLTLPIVRASRNDLELILDEITRSPSLKLVSHDSQSSELLGEVGDTLLRPVGRANEAHWTGWHGTDRLFFPKD